MKKIFYSFVLSLALLFSISYCAPNVYALNNFYSGSGMVFAPSEISGGQYDNSNWQWVVSPTATTGNAGKYKDVNVVNSFSNIIMSGSTEVTSVPLVDFDRNVGKYLSLPKGTCAVIYSRSFNAFTSSAPVIWSVLGFDKPVPYGVNSNHRTLASTTSAGLSSITFKGSTQEIISELGAYTFVFNFSSDEDILIQVEDYQSDGIIDVVPTPISQTHWIVNTSSIGSSNILYALPHINGVADIYVLTHHNTQIATDTDVKLKVTYGNTVTTINGSTIKVQWQNSLITTNTVRFTDYTISVDYSTSGSSKYETFPYNEFNGCPTFLNNTIYLFPYSININNTRELAKAIADALQSSGGGGDYNELLNRILAELQLSNSGGPLGETVRQGMQALEQHHQTIIDRADFDSFADGFDGLSYLFDFDNDMHWIITANNALFGYFAGFILLCCLLLTIGRIMR